MVVPDLPEMVGLGGLVVIIVEELVGRVERVVVEEGAQPEVYT